jgi:chromosome segregation ATPase
MIEMFFDSFNKFFRDEEKKMDEEMKNIFSDNNEKDGEKDNECHSYYHEVANEYEDGERVYHKEKVVKDGKVIKDEAESAKLEDIKASKKAIEKKSEKDETTDLENLVENVAGEVEKKKKTIKEWRDYADRLCKERRALHDKIVDLEKEIEKLTKENKTLKDENKEFSKRDENWRKAYNDVYDKNGSLYDEIGHLTRKLESIQKVLS